MRWQKKLNKKERRHMKEWCSNSVAGLKRNILHNSAGLPCWDCWGIAGKLGLLEELRPEMEKRRRCEI